MPILTCKRVHYGSQGDETAFFDWIKRISCVTQFEGSGDILYLHVSRNRISDVNLRELLALFSRYHVPMKSDRFNRSKSKGFYRRTTRGFA